MKFITSFFIILLLSLSFFLSANRDIVFLNVAQNYDGTISFYTSYPQSIDGANCVINGNSGIVSCNSQSANKVYSKLNGIVGISFVTKGDNKTLTHIFDDLKLTILSKECVDKFIIYLAHTSLFSNHIMVDNKKVNIQIALKDGDIIIGTPVILGSY